MTSPTPPNKWHKRRSARIAGAFAVLAIAAASIGIAPGGAGAANGWGRYVQPATTVSTTKAATITSTPEGPQTQAVVNGNGWG